MQTLLVWNTPWERTWNSSVVTNPHNLFLLHSYQHTSTIKQGKAYLVNESQYIIKVVTCYFSSQRLTEAMTKACGTTPCTFQLALVILALLLASCALWAACSSQTPGFVTGKYIRSAVSSELGLMKRMDTTEFHNTHEPTGPSLRIQSLLGSYWGMTFVCRQEGEIVCVGVRVCMSEWSSKCVLPQREVITIIITQISWDWLTQLEKSSHRLIWAHPFSFFLFFLFKLEEEILPFLVQPKSGSFFLSSFSSSYSQLSLGGVEDIFFFSRLPLWLCHRAYFQNHVMEEER